MKKVNFKLGIGLLLCLTFRSGAQLSGAYSVPATFTSIAAAVASLNTAGVSAAVTINIAAGYTETAPVGGYTLGAIVGASATNSITFQKSGSGVNPLVSAYTGTATPASGVQDGVWWLIGSDYITIDAIDITDPNTSNPGTMEFGYGLYKASATDGCQFNTIKNCVITLNRINNAASAGPVTEGSRGIDVMNATAASNTVALTVTSASGSNSNNKFYANTIQNCNIGIAVIGFAAPTPFTLADTGNDIGGASAGTGNMIINFGGGGTTSAAAGIRTLAQYGLNVSFNVINSNNGSGVNHGAILRGIYLNTAVSANASVNNNTVTVSSGGTTQQLTGIENASGSTAATNTIAINNNLITNCTYTGSTTGVFYAIWNNGASPNVLSISNNTVSNNSTTQASGNLFNIYNSGSVNGIININNNVVSLGTFNAASTSITYAGIYNSAGNAATTLNVTANNIKDGTFSGATGGTGAGYLIYNSTTQSLTNMVGNIFDVAAIKSSGSFYFIYNSNGTPNSIASGNIIATPFSKTVAGGTVYGYYNFGSPGSGTATISGNLYSGVTLTGATVFYGIYQATSVNQTENVNNNTVSNITGGTSAVYGIYHSYGAAGSSVSSNTITSLSGAGIIYGISHGNTASTQMIVNNNSLNTFTSTGASVVYGIYQVGGTTTYMYKNKIYNLLGNNAGSTVAGIYVSAGATTGIFNNLVGDLKATAANNVNAVTGIYLAGGSGIGVYFNSVNLAATSSGALFGTAALFASTTPSIDIRNNIFKNTSTPNGTGLTVAFWRNGTTLSTFSTSSNYNSYYAGSPGTNNLIFYDGTNAYQTFSSYQTAVAPREINSFTENTPFLSIVGLSTNFLHINPTSTSATESGGVNIAGITDDFDAQVRQGNTGYTGSGTAPDVGADEYNQTLPPCVSASAGAISPASFTRCAGQTISANSTGYTAAASIVHQWKAASVAGGPYSNVSGGSGATTPAFTSSALATGTFYLVMVTTCTLTNNSGTSNEATVTVNAVPTASASTTTSVLCSGESILLSGGSNIGTSYAWSGPNSYISSSQNSTITNAGSNATGMYSLVVSNSNCTATPVSLSVTVNQTPSAITLTPLSASLCAGSSQTIDAAGGSVNATFAFGTQANQNIATTGSTGYPAPYTVYYGGQRMQMLILANELLAAGFSPGTPITSIQFPVVSFGANWGSTITENNNFQVNIGTTALTALSAFQSGLTNVVAPANFTPVVGYNNLHTFSTPFIWNGTSNVVLETTFSNNLSGVAADLVTQYNSPTTFQSTIVYRADSQAATAIATNNTISYAYSARPDFKLNGVSVGTFSWSPAAGLSATSGPSVAATPSATANYTVTSLLAGCSSSASINLSVTPAPTLNIVPSATSVCSGNSVTMAVSGADTYTWDNNATTTLVTVSPTITSDYTVTGQNQNCPAVTATINIVANPLPTITAVASVTTVCSGKTVTLAASGASTYVWSNNALTFSTAVTPTANTNYTVTGTSSLGCVSSATVALSTSPLPVITIVPSSTTICLNTSAGLTASGASTYAWVNGSSGSVNTVTPAVNTIYTVTGTSSAGCSATQTAAVNTNSLPVVIITPPAATICVDEVITFTSTGGDTYTWQPANYSGNTFTASPATSQVYTVTATDVNSCKNSVSVNLVIDPCTGVNNSMLEMVSVFPNPSNGIITATFEFEGKKAILITNGVGSVVAKALTEEQVFRFDLSYLAKGIYFLNLSARGTNANYKIIIE
jgi:hypothetical protein